MTLDDLRRLDPKNIGSWPVLPKFGVLLLTLVLLIFASYWFNWKNQLTDITTSEQKEDTLRQTFMDKKKQAIDLEAYRQQLAEIDKAFGTLLKQLPSKSEMESLLTDINQAGLGRGLHFELFKPAAAETMSEFYAELPITVRVTGGYHDIGAFTSDISKLSRIVLINDISLTPNKDNSGLIMDATAKTYRYLDEDEVAAQRKNAKAAKVKGGANPADKK